MKMLLLCSNQIDTYTPIGVLYCEVEELLER